jgi:hypothetical protein
MTYRIKGHIQLHLFLFGFGWGYLVGFVCFVLGIAAAIIELPASIFGLIIAVVSILLGLILFVKDSKEIKRVEADLYEVSVNPTILKSLQKSDKYDKYEFINFGEYYALYSHEVNRLFTAKTLEFKLEHEKFHMDSVARSIAPFALRTAFKSGAVLFNSPKVGMKSDLTVEEIKSGCKVLLQQTDYFLSLCTNEMSCREVRSRTSNRLFDGLSFMSNNGIILDFQESKCSNHIGVSTLAFTSDGKMVITIQSAESAQSAKLLAPSGSGSADHNDLKQQPKTFQTFIASAMERELLGECGIVNNMDGLVKTHLIGFARLLNRGGKPEFFGVSFLNVPFDKLRITSKETVFIADITGTRVSRKEIPEFKDALDRFRREHEGTFSFLLYLNLRFLEDYLDSSPNSFLELIGGRVP